MIAHVAGVPVEEFLPVLVGSSGLLMYEARQRLRRRREERRR
jgi:hypothetical protein